MGLSFDESAELRGIVARGYCHEKNRHKELDGDLLEAIVEELISAKERICGCGHKEGRHFVVRIKGSGNRHQVCGQGGPNGICPCMKFSERVATEEKS